MCDRDEECIFHQGREKERRLLEHCDGVRAGRRSKDAQDYEEVGALHA